MALLDFLGSAAVSIEFPSFLQRGDRGGLSYYFFHNQKKNVCLALSNFFPYPEPAAVKLAQNPVAGFFPGIKSYFLGFRRIDVLCRKPMQIVLVLGLLVVAIACLPGRKFR
jgi:hypothetical protein